jgi:hypothetical protein
MSKMVGEKKTSGTSTLMQFFLLTGIRLINVHNVLVYACLFQNKPTVFDHPFEILFKRKPRLPIEIASLTQEIEDDDVGSEETMEQLDTYMNSMMGWTDELHTKAKENIARAQEK